jgi:hypothetical protein
MTTPRRSMDRGSRAQLVAVLLVTALVMLLGILVVVAPDRMGVPRPVATPATPVTRVTGCQGVRVSGCQVTSVGC